MTGVSYFVMLQFGSVDRVFGGFVDAAVAALTDFSWDFVEAEVEQR